MSQFYVLGVDIGTTSTKAIVFSSSGAIAGMGNQGYPMLVPQPMWAEQDPKVVFAAVIDAVRDAVVAANLPPSAIAAMGFSSAMHSLIVMDAENEPLTNSIIWADNRSRSQTEQLQQNGIGHHLYLRTGTPIHPMLPLTKLIWLRELNSDTFSKAAKFISIKEYVLYQLFERYIVDYAIASTTGLFNLQQLNWDQEALNLAQISRQQLSELVPTTYVLCSMKLRYAQAMQLTPDLPVVVGASDGVLANLGVGAILPSRIAVTIGTSGAVRTVTSTPKIDQQGRTFCYPLINNYWVIGGAVNNGGIVLRWLRDQLCAPEVEQAQRLGKDAYEVMIQAAMQVPVGAEGLLFLPFLSGERSPYWNPQARGVFFGLGLHHKRSHLIRAVLEGILFSVYSVNVVLQELIGTTQEIRASGGFARSPVWRQLMADLFGYELLMPKVYEASSFGAALLAMYALGAIADLTEVEKLIQITNCHQPDIKLSRIYHEMFSVYERIYQNLLTEFRDLQKFTTINLR